METKKSTREEKKRTERRWLDSEELEERVLGKIANLFFTICNPTRLVTLYKLRERKATGMEWVLVCSTLWTF
jgi:hypothetical protein